MKPISQSSEVTKAVIRALVPAIVTISVVGDGAAYTAINMQTGAIVSTGSVASTVIQAAFAGLTALRARKEKITLFGDFNVATEIDIPSYVDVEVYATIDVTGTNSIWGASGKTAISFKGGTYNMPLTGTSAAQRGFDFSSCTDVNIDEAIVYAGSGHSINFSSCTGAKVTNSDLSFSGDDGISFVGSTGGYFAHNKSHDHRSISGGSSGIEIEDQSNDVLAFDNKCYNNAQGIQSIVDSGAAFDGNKNITIRDNHCHDNTSVGISVQFGGTGTDNISQRVLNNQLEDNGQNILVTNTIGGRVSGNIIDGSTALNGIGINVITCTDLDVTWNEVTGVNGNGINYTGNGIRVTWNTIKNCGQDGNTNNNYGIQGTTSHADCEVLWNKLIDNQGIPTMGGIRDNAGTEIDIFYNKFDGLASVTGAGLIAIYIQSAGGRVTTKYNTEKAGDTVKFVTEARGRTNAQATGTAIPHGITIANTSVGGALVVFSANDPNVRDQGYSIDNTNLTPVHTTGGSVNWSWSVEHWERGV